MPSLQTSFEPPHRLVSFWKVVSTSKKSKDSQKRNVFVLPFFVVPVIRFVTCFYSFRCLFVFSTSRTQANLFNRHSDKNSIPQNNIKSSRLPPSLTSFSLLYHHFFSIYCFHNTQQPHTHTHNELQRCRS